MEDLLTRIQGLAAPDRDALGWQPVTLEKDARLFKQGDDAGALYVVAEGTLGIVEDGVCVDRAIAGGTLGEASVFFPGDTRLGSAVARERCRLWVLPRASLLALLDHDPAFYDALLEHGLRRTFERLAAKDKEIAALQTDGKPAVREGAAAPKACWPPERDIAVQAPITVIDALRKVPVLERATEETRARLFWELTPCYLEEGQALFVQGDEADAVFIVASGAVSVAREVGDGLAQELISFEAGSMFGGSSFVAKQPRSATVLARAPTWVLGITADEAETLPDVARRALLEAVLTTGRAQLRAAKRLLARLSRPENDFSAFLRATGHLEGWRAGDPLTEVAIDELVAPAAVKPVDDAFASLASLIRRSVVGQDAMIETPFGARRLVYADYTASGRSLSFIEDFIRERVMPLYANTHTEASASGLQTSRLREEARAAIAKSVGACDEDEVVFVGAGATGAINRMVDLLGLRLPLGQKPGDVPASERPVVFIGPYEHHSNILPWRHSTAEVIEIPLDDEGGLDLRALEAQLVAHADRPLRIGSFSAGSNVTGIATPVDDVACLLHAHDALSFWDYAAAGPYVPIDMNPDRPGAHHDAIFLSPHKFVGGPGTPGVLVLKKKLVTHGVPAQPGGGTVDFVTATDSLYSASIAHREESGTPAILESIRCGLVFQLKDRAGAHRIHEMEQRYVRAAIASWSQNPAIRVLGSLTAERLSIVSFLVRHGRGYLHYNFVVALLNDLFGVQARGGCSCAGPYGARLFGLDTSAGEAYLDLSAEGMHSCKPGWARVNFNYFISEPEFRYIVEAVQLVALYGYALLPDYTLDPISGIWSHKAGNPHRPASLADLTIDGDRATWPTLPTASDDDVLSTQLAEGRTTLLEAACAVPPSQAPLTVNERFERWRWFPLPHEQVAWLRYVNGEGERPALTPLLSEV